MASRRFPMKRRDLALALFVVSASAAPAAAHHPGADLDRVMGSKEKYFQQIGRASCRERVSVRVDLGGRSILKKTKLLHSSAHPIRALRRQKTHKKEILHIQV